MKMRNTAADKNTGIFSIKTNHTGSISSFNAPKLKPNMKYNITISPIEELTPEPSYRYISVIRHKDELIVVQANSIFTLMENWHRELVNRNIHYVIPTVRKISSQKNYLANKSELIASNTSAKLNSILDKFSKVCKSIRGSKSKSNVQIFRFKKGNNNEQDGM